MKTSSPQRTPLPPRVRLRLKAAAAVAVLILVLVWSSGAFGASALPFVLALAGAWALEANGARNGRDD